MAKTLELEELANLISQLSLSSSQDKWEFTLCTSRRFIVQSLRYLINDSSTATDQTNTRWNKLVPNKVNISSWRVVHARLPTRVNLDVRGIDLHSVRCPLCDDDVEMEVHLFISCKIAKETCRFHENRPPMLNKENYVLWSSRLLRYAKSRPNGKLIYNSIMNGAYARRMIPEPGDADREFSEDSQEIWLRVQQMMKGSDIGIQEKKAKLFNEWESRHVTIIHQTKDLHTAYYTQLYDFLKYNQNEVDDLRAEQLEKTHDPLALMANSNNPFNYLVFHQDQPSSSTYMQQPLPNNNNNNPQPSFNQNYMQQPMPNPKDITDPTTAMNMKLVLMAKAFKLNYSTPTKNNKIISSNSRNRQIAQLVQNFGNQVVQNAVQNPGVQNVRNQNGLIVVPGIANQNPNNVVAARAEGNAIRNNGNQIRCYNYRGLGHLARNCTVRPMRRDDAYLQTQLLIAQKEEAGIQLQAEEFDLMAATADLDEIEETDKLSVEQDGGTVNSVNGRMNETNVDLTTELARVSDDTTPSVAQKFLNDVKSTIVTLQHVVKQIMTLDIHNWSSSVHQEIHKIVKDKIFPIINQVDAKLQNFKIQFLKETAEFVRDFKSLAKEADESLVKHKAIGIVESASLESIKSKRASHPPKPVPNSKQRLHLLHMDLCGLMRITSINGKRSKMKTKSGFKTFLKRITVLLQSPCHHIKNPITGTEFKNQVLKEYFDSVGISHQSSSVRTPQQNGVVERRNPDVSCGCLEQSDTVPTPTNSSSQAADIPNTLQDVDELPQQQNVKQQDDQDPL
ncbi:integrase, catalytic region, zinc finger, CCHC-type containing protein [Tanacetum coccineum]